MQELAEFLHTGGPYCEQFISSNLHCLTTFRYRVWHCDGRQLTSSPATSDALFNVCWQPRSEGFYPPPTVTPVVVSKPSVPASQQEGIASSFVVRISVLLASNAAVTHVCEVVKNIGQSCYRITSCHVPTWP